jgi:hypothetical protein
VYVDAQSYVLYNLPIYNILRIKFIFNIYYKLMSKTDINPIFEIIGSALLSFYYGNLHNGAEIQYKQSNTRYESLTESYKNYCTLFKNKFEAKINPETNLIIKHITDFGLKYCTNIGNDGISTKTKLFIKKVVSEFIPNEYIGVVNDEMEISYFHTIIKLIIGRITFYILEKDHVTFFIDNRSDETREMLQSKFYQFCVNSRDKLAVDIYKKVHNVEHEKTDIIKRLIADLKTQADEIIKLRKLNSDLQEYKTKYEEMLSKIKPSGIKQANPENYSDLFKPFELPPVTIIHPDIRPFHGGPSLNEQKREHEEKHKKMVEQQKEIELQIKKQAEQQKQFEQQKQAEQQKQVEQPQDTKSSDNEDDIINSIKNNLADIDKDVILDEDEDDNSSTPSDNFTADDNDTDWM